MKPLRPKKFELDLFNTEKNRLFWMTWSFFTHFLEVKVAVAQKFVNKKLLIHHSTVAEKCQLRFGILEPILGPLESFVIPIFRFQISQFNRLTRNVGY